MAVTSLHLSERLSMVANLLDMGNVYADIGCDHGYLPISLIAEGRFSRAIAMDINEGPLSKAADNIKRYGLTDCIETRLSDGVSALKCGEADVISICGMGGNVMMRIFEAGADVLKSADIIVIQPQSEYAKLSNYIRLQGYTIVDEDIVYEDGHYYFAWKLKSGQGDGSVVNFLDECGFYHSPILLERCNSIYRSYLEHHQSACDTAIANIRANLPSDAVDQPSESPSARRMEQLMNERSIIADNINLYYN